MLNSRGLVLLLLPLFIIDVAIRSYTMKKQQGKSEICTSSDKLRSFLGQWKYRLLLQSKRIVISPLFSPQPHGALEEHVTVHFDIVNPGNNVDPPKLPTYVSLNIS